MYCNYCIPSSGTKPCDSHISSWSLFMAKALFVTYTVTYLNTCVPSCGHLFLYQGCQSKLRRKPHSPSLVVTSAGSSSFDPLYSINNCDFFFFFFSFGSAWPNFRHIWKVQHFWILWFLWRQSFCREGQTGLEGKNQLKKTPHNLWILVETKRSIETIIPFSESVKSETLQFYRRGFISVHSLKTGRRDFSFNIEEFLLRGHFLLLF